MRHARSRLGGLAALLPAAILLAAGCVPNGNAGPASGNAAEAGANAPVVEEALPVEVTALGRGEIEASLGASATLEAESAVTVFARSEGLVQEIYVEEGNAVERGELLIRLEDVDQRNQLAKVEGQLAKARREYQRQQRLFAQELISEVAFNDATYEIEQLELSLADATRSLELTEIRAPIGGTVTSRSVSVGDRVAPSAPLFDIIDFDSLVARIFVPEKELSRLRAGLPARVKSQALPGRRYTGRLIRVAPVVDARSGTVKATVKIGAQPGLLPGMYVDVALITDTRDEALLVPKRALVYDGDLSFVYRMTADGRVERIAVEAALSNEQFVQPRGDVLSAGDRIVVAGQAALKQGALVRVLGAGAPSGEGAGAGS